MIDHLRIKIALALNRSSQVTLTTFGPADLQSSQVPCEFANAALFVLVPRSSEHLANLEYRPALVASTSEWELRGLGRILPSRGWPAGLRLARALEASWSSLIEIQPAHLTLFDPQRAGRAETIDF